ncbi:MAG: 4-hydroxythreonine-4-phosphate dehydrogenase PdxA [Deltaproteobacteria bacterium]|nr:4-hydroxythreonine-4-phosphate dehydrogenase PdxA [Deltaproteobacteria bacterium]
MENVPPIIGITIGDAAGIGPEVVAKAVRCEDVRAICRPLVIGDARVFADPKFSASMGDADVIYSPADASFTQGRVTVLDLQNLDPVMMVMGQVQPVAGRAAVEYVLKATELALSGVIDAVATGPLNKEAIRLAGYPYIGHTELLKAVTHTERCTTMLATPGLRVTHVTRHIPFREIAAHITEENVLNTILITHEGMRSLGYAAPRLAVAGLNPHSGEGGLLGREEIEAIAPAVACARSRGLDVRGPVAADSVFFKALRGDYDAVVTLYHDQGHIAVKTHGFEQSIAITLGLPIIRTSADHGTAFDIAGQGIASADSMQAAIIEAARIARRRQGMAAEA